MGIRGLVWVDAHRRGAAAWLVLWVGAVPVRWWRWASYPVGQPRWSK